MGEDHAHAEAGLLRSLPDFLELRVGATHLVDATSELGLECLGEGYRPQPGEPAGDAGHHVVASDVVQDIGTEFGIRHRGDDGLAGLPGGLLGGVVEGL